jgi:hypothetical protein|tara:strand:+ start:293 stop:586 length:294 start_codon:yes stop_codon:yes gene_type:complete
MILNLTDAEALALSQRLRGKTEPNAEVLETATAKLEAAMQKSDAKLGRSLDYAISSLESSGFDSEQLTALRGAKDKATIHNESKYVGVKGKDAYKEG